MGLVLKNLLLKTSDLVFNSAECQSKVRLVGGLRALINVFKRFVSLEKPDNQDFCIMERVVNTIASSTAGHGKLYLGRFYISKQAEVFKFTRNLEKR